MFRFAFLEAARYAQCSTAQFLPDSCCDPWRMHSSRWPCVDIKKEDLHWLEEPINQYIPVLGGSTRLLFWSLHLKILHHWKMFKDDAMTTVLGTAPACHFTQMPPPEESELIDMWMSGRRGRAEVG